MPKVCYHDVAGVKIVKGTCTCKKCKEKIPEAQAKALLGDCSSLPVGVTQIGAVTVTKEPGKTVVMHGMPEPPPSMHERYVPYVERHPETAPKELPSGKIVKGTTMTINCMDCGIERVIKVQDAFQVKRCVDCQKKFRNHKRYEKRKQEEQE